MNENLVRSRADGTCWLDECESTDLTYGLVTTSPSVFRKDQLVFRTCEPCAKQYAKEYRSHRAFPFPAAPDVESEVWDA